LQRLDQMPKAAGCHALHRLAVIQVPLHDQPAITVYVDVARRVVPFPRDEHEPAPADLGHAQMLPCAVTSVKQPDGEISCPHNAPAHLRRAHTFVNSTPDPTPAVRCSGLFGGPVAIGSDFKPLLQRSRRSRLAETSDGEPPIDVVGEAAEPRRLACREDGVQ